MLPKVLSPVPADAGQEIQVFSSTAWAHNVRLCVIIARSTPIPSFMPDLMADAASDTLTQSFPYERTRRYITIRGARQHNLQNIDLDLPKHNLLVFTGPSGSGKSSLAFHTIYAEGQRRYVESLSAYARQFLERMDKPDVDLITGLAPAIAIEQKTLSKNPRSTVATQTEIYDHLRLLFAQIGKTYSPVSGEVVTKDSPRSVAVGLHERMEDGARLYLGFPFPHHEDASTQKECEALLQRGFFRLLVLPEHGEANETVLDLNETPPATVAALRERLFVLHDRLRIKSGDAANQSRIADSVFHAFREGGGHCVVIPAGDAQPEHYSEHFEKDGMVFAEPAPRLFSFNSPVGACPACQGFGRVRALDENLVIPDQDLSIRKGAIAPFRFSRLEEYYSGLIMLALKHHINIDVPYRALPEQHREILWNGTPGIPGIRAIFRQFEERSYTVSNRLFHARYKGESRCTQCDGYRLRREALYTRVEDLHIGEVTAMTTRQASQFFEDLTLTAYEQEVAGLLLDEIRKRLRFLVEVGLDYLTLDRLANSLSGGESQRINLATSLGSSLVGSLYVLDEPTIGLHPRDTARLVGILKNLRDLGNTVIVVEHEAEVMRHADEIVDLGPKSGRNGGRVIFQGSYDDMLQDTSSLTGAYLSGRKQIPLPERRRKPDGMRAIVVEEARQHNLKRITARFPLRLIVCVTGVSGSGKSTLVHDTLYLGLRQLLGLASTRTSTGRHDAITGIEYIDSVEMVDQSPIGRTPRSNLLTYTKTFDPVRQLLAGTNQARLRGHTPGSFSFNVPGGRCDECQGEGVVKVDMQFLADLYLTCEACKGARYKKDVLEVRYRKRNIHEILEMTVDEAIEFFSDVPAAANRLRVLGQIGLGYLKIGQPATTLSGGEAQRIKLAAHMCNRAQQHTLYIFDEPTTGLHFDDIRKLLAAFDALVDQGHSIVVIEHNLDVIRHSDWILDLGPEGGWSGGYIVAEGTPEQIAEHRQSHTGRFLRRTMVP